MTESTLYHNGFVYSAADPFAQALQVRGSEIVWLGPADAVAEQAQEATRHVDLAGALLAPGFVQTISGPITPETTDLLKTQGVLGVVEFLEAPLQVPFAAEDDIPFTVYARYLRVSEEYPLYARVMPGSDERVIESFTESDGSLAGFVDSAVSADIQLSLVTTEISDQSLLLDLIEGYLAALAQSADKQGTARVQSVNHRIDGRIALAEGTLEQMLAWGIGVTISPTELDFAPLGTLLTAGVPTAVSSWARKDSSPWQEIRAGIQRVGGDAVSARAGFLASTRAPLRLAVGLEELPPAAGTLSIGAEARFVTWKADSLSVQTPSSAIQAWSTDARAGTPLLPDLSDGEPVWAYSVLGGREIS